MIMDNDYICSEIPLEIMFHFTFTVSDWLHQLEVYLILYRKL